MSATGPEALAADFDESARPDASPRESDESDAGSHELTAESDATLIDSDLESESEIKEVPMSGLGKIKIKNPAASASSPAFQGDMVIKINAMKQELQRQRTDAKKAVRAHREAEARLIGAKDDQTEKRHELLNREKILAQRRTKVSLVERQVVAFQHKLMRSASEGKVSQAFWDLAEAKLDDLQRERDTLHTTELSFVTYMRAASDSDLNVGKARVQEMRQSLELKQKVVSVSMKNEEISSIEKVSQNWIDMKKELEKQSRAIEEERERPDNVQNSPDKDDEKRIDSNPTEEEEQEEKEKGRSPAARQVPTDGEAHVQTWPEWFGLPAGERWI